MSVPKRDADLLRDLRHQSNAVLALYLFAGAAGLVGALILGTAAVIETTLVFLSGLVLGLSVEKLVTRRIRRIALALVESRDDERAPDN